MHDAKTSLNFSEAIEINFSLPAQTISPSYLLTMPLLTLTQGTWPQYELENTNKIDDTSFSQPWSNCSKMLQLTISKYTFKFYREKKKKEREKRFQMEHFFDK